MSNPGTILINGQWRYHPILTGVTLLHEAYHAFWNRKRPELVDAVPEIAMAHEKDAWNFQSSILLAVFGRRYLDLLTIYTQRMRSELTTGPADTLFIGKWQTRDELEPFYGSFMFEQEFILADEFFLAHAHMKMIAEGWPDDCESLQTRLMQQMMLRFANEKPPSS